MEVTPRSSQADLRGASGTAAADSASEANIEGRSHWPISILSMISAAVNLTLPLVLVRVLPPEDVGTFRVFFLYLIIVPAFSLTAGIRSGLAYWAGNKEVGKEAIRASSSLTLLSALLFVGTALLFHERLAGALGWQPEYGLIYAAALLGAIASGFVEEAAIVTGRVWTGAIFYSGFEILRTGSMLVTLFLTRSLPAVCIAHTVVITLKVLVGYLYGLRFGLVGSAGAPGRFREVCAYAFPVSLAWVFGIFVGFADQLILSTNVSRIEFALYSIGCLSIPPLLILEQSITRVLIPQLSHAFARGNAPQAAMLYRNAAAHLALILIPSVAGLVVFSHPIIELLFTRQYGEASRYLVAFAFSYALLIVPYDAIARARGQATWILRTFVAFSALSLGLAFLFTLWWGPMGALASLLVTGLCLRVFSVAYFSRTLPARVSELVPLRLIAELSLLSVVIGVAAYSSRPLFWSDRAWMICIGPIAAVLAVYAGLVLKNREERRLRTPERILMVTQTVDVGGLERMILKLCAALREREQWHLRVFAYDQRGESANLISHFRAAGIPVDASHKGSGFSLRVVLRLVHSVLRNDIHIVHCHDLGGLMYASLAKILTGWRFTLILTQHSFLHLGVNRRYRLYERLFTRFVDRIAVVSVDTMETYERLGMKTGKLHLVENGVEFSDRSVTSRQEKLGHRTELMSRLPAEARRTLERHREDFWILYLARIFPGKGQDHAVELWKALDARVRSESVMIFVGPDSSDGERERVLELAAGAAANDRLIFLPATDVPHDWLLASDLYLSCSRYEGMPLGPLEAVGAGLPTLLSDIPGHRFLGAHAKFFPLDDAPAGAAALSGIIDQLRSDAAMVYSAMSRSRELVRDHYSVKRMAQHYSSLYRGSLAAQESSLAGVAS